MANTSLSTREDKPREALSRATPLRRHSLYEAVTERLREMVLEGELEPGSRISEKQLCEAFEVSPTPLRQALKVLVSEGLVEMLPNRGARVTEVDVEEVADLFEVMAVLEGLSGTLLATRASDAEIAEIRHLHECMMEKFRKNQRNEYFQLNQTIHRRLAEIAGNRVLLELETSLTLRITRARYAANMQMGRWEESAKEHECLVEALEKRDAQGLSAAMSLHMRKTGNAVIQRLKQD
ncbi:GntR family transcriptional regulator [Marinobacter sp.]|uniref:GntR family transcriptional regulator n=1 Tax=Marinobacter sp. TaxID=50741 RepID=UPI003564D94F